MVPGTMNGGEKAEVERGAAASGAPSLRASPSLTRRLPDPAPFSGRMPALLSSLCPVSHKSESTAAGLEAVFWPPSTGRLKNGGDGVVRELGAVGVRSAVQAAGSRWVRGAVSGNWPFKEP